MIYYNKRQYYNYKLEKGGIMELTIDSIFTKLEAVNYDYIFTNNFFEIKEEEITYGSKIKYNQGNIPIKLNLLNKYENVREIFDNESNKLKKSINLKNDIVELKNIDIVKVSSSNAKKIARCIFNKYNLKDTFENNGNKIIVTGRGIEESINKIFSSKDQRKLLQEHFEIFAHLGEIISKATLVNQIRELKCRSDINCWNYYLNNLQINNNNYSLEFDVRSMSNGQNQYRVQRLKKQGRAKKIKTDNSTRDVSKY